ncbi:MAG: hypothetical protein ABR998_00460 [Gemmatimonadales bacterium]|jgi:hypothetical protein
MSSTTKRLTAGAVLALALYMAACKETTSPTADPTAIATGVTGLNSTFSQNAVFQSLSALSTSFTLSAPIARPLTTPLGPSASDWGLMLRLAGQARGPMLALFPINVQGKVFQWDTAGGGKYRITDSSLAVPENGVRYILYQVSPSTDRPSLPLTTTGYVDLIDQSTQQANVLHLLLKVGTQTAADYTISQVKTTTVDTLKAVGYVTDVVAGGTPVNFTLSHALTLSDSSLVTVYSASGNAAAVTMHTSYSGAGGGNVALDWVVQKNGSLEVVGNSTSSTINFQFKFNGTDWATVGGTPSAPTFTGAGGGTLTATDLVAVAQVLQGFYNIGSNLSGVFGPAFLVFK